MRTPATIACLALAVLLPGAALRAQDAAASRPELAPKDRPVFDPLPSPMPGDAAPEKAEVQATETGLRYIVLDAGDEEHADAHPGKKDKVHVHYAGYLENGTKFDSTSDGREATFGVSEVIAGWTEGLQLMSPGARFKFIIPWKLAYGERGSPPRIPSRANLIFDVELLSFDAAPKPLPAPAFVLPPDSELTTTPSGLKYKVLRAAEGPKPLISDSVTVHYAGWLLDGTGFDNSYGRGEPTSFPLNGVIKGWGEGLQLMPVGSSFLFVIPASLAYGARGAGGVIPPDATLVFEVELLKIGGGH